MRERRLIVDGSVCDSNLYADGVQTVEQFREVGKQLCPHWSECSRVGAIDPDTGHQCVMQMGQVVAREVLKTGSSVTAEMADFRRAGIEPPEGWFYSPDRSEFRVVSEQEEALTLVGDFARIIIGGTDGSMEGASDKLSRVGPRFEDVVAFSTTPEGAVDLAAMEQLEGRFGSNGGRGCDVRSGPCSCGAWH